MSRKISLLLAAALFWAPMLFATIFGSVRGIVHDQQHRPIPNTQVVLKAKNSDYQQTAQTNAEGEFQFDSVPVGEYTVEVTKTGLDSLQQSFAVLSGTAPVLHLEMHLATQAQSITVTSDAAPAQAESITPTTLVTREEISETPGASRTNSLSMITDYVPGSYVTHDQLHIRGGHQVTW